MAERTLAILVTAKNLASKVLKNVSKDVDKLKKTAARGFGEAARNAGKLAIAGAGISLALGVGAVKAAGDFEAQLNTINTVARATPAQLEAIGAGIRKIARDTGTPLEELTTGFYDLVSAGVAADQAQRVLASSNRIAIGGLATAAEGVDLLTTAMNSYGVAVDQQGAASERFADVFAKAIERGKVTAAELAASFAQVGPLASTMGIEIEELAAGYAQLTAKGVPAAEAATQMRAAMISLVRTTGPLEKLQKQTKRNYAAIAERKGLTAAFEQLRVDAKKAGVPLIDLVGRQEALAYALGTTGAALDGYNANLEAMENAEGTAARQMSERQKGLNFQLARLRALALDAGITIGSKLLPKLTPLAEKAVAFLEVHQDDIERFGDEIAAGFERAADFAQRIPWEAVGSGLKTAASWAEKLMGVFLGLPPEVQGTIVALAGLNKLSGGAVSGIVGELGKGLIKGVLGMTAGVVNLNAGVVNGGGGGVPGAGGGGRGVTGFGGRLGILNNPLLRMAGLLGGGMLLAGSNAGTGGVGGLGGNALGGAMAGAGLGGPLGAIAGALTGAVKSVAEQQSAGTANMAANVRDGLNSSIAGKTMPELRTALAAVDQGIAEIRSNPLTTVLHGDALAQLEGMRGDLQRQISKEAEAALIAQRAGEKSTAAGDKVAAEMRAARAAQQAAASRTSSENAGIRAAIAAQTAALRSINFSPRIVVPITVPAPRVAISLTERGRIRYYQYGNGGPVHSRVDL